MSEIIDVVIIADASGSMHPYYKDTINGMVNVVESQKKHENTRFTIATFHDSDFNILLDMRDIKDFVPTKKFFRENYKFGGMTPLYKCSIKIMERMQRNIYNTPLCMRPSKIVCTIITDGLDNSSGAYTLDDFNYIINRMGKENWNFAYIGMGKSAQLQGKETIIKQQYCVDASSEGVTKSYNNINNFVGIVRGT